MLGAAGGGARGQNWRRTATPPAAADAADHSSGDGDGLDTASFGGGGGGGINCAGRKSQPSDSDRRVHISDGFHYADCFG